MSKERFTIVCGLDGPFHVVDHFYGGGYDVVGVGIVSFPDGVPAGFVERLNQIAGDATFHDAKVIARRLKRERFL